jgi:hypothetical protein
MPQDWRQGRRFLPPLENRLISKANGNKSALCAEKTNCFEIRSA